MSQSLLDELAQEEKARQEQYRSRVFCCTSTACVSAGANLTHAALDEAGGDKNSTDMEIVPTGCMGLCSKGPLVRVDSKEIGNKEF